MVTMYFHLLYTLEVLKALAERFGPDFNRIDQAVAAYLRDKTATLAQHVHSDADGRVPSP